MRKVSASPEPNEGMVGPQRWDWKHGDIDHVFVTVPPKRFRGKLRESAGMPDGRIEGCVGKVSNAERLEDG